MTDKKGFYLHICREKSDKSVFVIDINSELLPEFLQYKKGELFENC